MKWKETKCELTWDHEEDVLRLGEARGGPAAVQGHQHEHQPLGVERAPAQEEGQHHGH